MSSFEMGIMVIDSSGAIASNDDASRILSFPSHSENTSEALLPADIRRLVLPTFTAAPRTILGEIWSGQRRYNCLVMRVDNYCGDGTSEKSVLLMYRRWHLLADIELIAATYSFTPRERQCLEYLLLGLSNREIAQRMRISASTVNSFLHLIMVKMGASSRCGIPLRIVCALAQHSPNPHGRPLN